MSTAIGLFILSYVLLNLVSRNRLCFLIDLEYLSFAAPKARNVEAWVIGPGTSSIKFPSAESA